MTSIEQDLQTLGKEIQDLDSRAITTRIRLGQKLIEVREKHLWDGFDAPYSTWSDFLETGFWRLTGLQKRSGEDAIELAESPTLKAMGEKVAQIPTLSIARHIGRMDRLVAAGQGEPPSPALLELAIQPDTTTTEFRRQAGCTEGGMVKLWLESAETAKALQVLVLALQTGTPSALANFASFLEDPRMCAHAPTVDDRLDFIVGELIDMLDILEHPATQATA